VSAILHLGNISFKEGATEQAVLHNKEGKKCRLLFDNSEKTAKKVFSWFGTLKPIQKYM
jgi:hypothetical protein